MIEYYHTSKHLLMMLVTSYIKTNLLMSSLARDRIERSTFIDLKLYIQYDLPIQRSSKMHRLFQYNDLLDISVQNPYN